MKEFSNIQKLRELVSSRKGLFPVSFYVKEDGTSNAEAINDLWEDCFEDFVKMPLWNRAQSAGEGDRPACGNDGSFIGKAPADVPYLVFVPSEEETPRGTILVVHGGGFALRTPCEGPNIALYFHELGWNTAILTYRLLPFSRKESAADVLRAIRVIRSHKAEWKITDQVVAMGFSAGAMLSGNAATLWDPGNQNSEDPAERVSSRPDAAVISYGAMSYVSFPQPFGASDSEGDLALYGRTPEERYRYAPEKQITPDTPPMFIWQTMSDDGRHGMCLARACQDAGVPYELHIFEGGVHGLGLADGENALDMNVPHITHWAEMADEWLAFHRIR